MMDHLPAHMESEVFEEIMKELEDEYENINCSSPVPLQALALRSPHGT